MNSAARGVCDPPLEQAFIARRERGESPEERAERNKAGQRPGQYEGGKEERRRKGGGVRGERGGNHGAT
jgi:hypothetical protein